MAATDIPPRRGAIRRLPLVGRIIRDIEREPDSIWYLLVALISLLIVATVTWGVQVLALVALALVPAVFGLLIAITRG